MTRLGEQIRILLLPQSFAGGVLGALVMAGFLRLMRMAGWIEMSFERNLGLMATGQTDHSAIDYGLLCFVVGGGLIALIYAPIFRYLKKTGPFVGAAIGWAHGLIFAWGYQTLLIDPAYLPSRFPIPKPFFDPDRWGFGNGMITALILLVAYVIYGAVIGIVHEHALARFERRARSQTPEKTEVTDGSKKAA